MPYFSSSPAGINALLDLLDLQLATVVGNTKTVLNASVAAPPVSRLERETHYQFIGDPAFGVSSIANIGIFRYDDAGTLGVGFYGFTGTRPPIAILTISQGVSSPLGIVSVATVAPHGLFSGDIVAVNGTPLTSLHDGSTSNSAPAVITVTGASTFTYPSPNAQSVGPVAGGVAVPMYNLVQGRLIGGAEIYSHIILTDTPMTVIGYVDTFRICFWVLQGGTIQPVYLGTTSRTHIQDDESDVATLSASVSSGLGIALNFTSPRVNYYVGQPLWLISPNTALVELTSVAAVNSETEIEVDLVSGFNAGALVGADPMPLCIMATDKAPATADLETRTVFMPFHLDGSRTDPISQTYFPFPELLPGPLGVLDPDSGGRRIATSIMVGRTTSPSAIRGRQVGHIAIPGTGAGPPIAGDLARAGDPSAAPAVDYKFIDPATQVINPNGWSIGVGPGAT